MENIENFIKSVVETKFVQSENYKKFLEIEANVLNKKNKNTELKNEYNKKISDLENNLNKERENLKSIKDFEKFKQKEYEIEKMQFELKQLNFKSDLITLTNEEEQKIRDISKELKLIYENILFEVLISFEKTLVIKDEIYKSMNNILKLNNTSLNLTEEYYWFEHQIKNSPMYSSLKMKNK